MSQFFNTAKEQSTLPVGKDTESNIVKSHASIDLLKSIRGLSAEGIIGRLRSEETH